eukprot:1032280-Pleurochrysis_carterae.AAC.4
MRRTTGAIEGGGTHWAVEDSRVGESTVVVAVNSSPMLASALEACRHSARPCVSVVKAISEPFSANRALRAASASTCSLSLASEVASAARVSVLRGLGRGRFGSIALLRLASPRTANACAAFGFASSSRRILRASVSLSTLRAALKVSERLPTPALSDSLTSSRRVERPSLRRRTALATFSERTESGSCAAVGSARLSL